MTDEALTPVESLAISMVYAITYTVHGRKHVNLQTVKPQGKNKIM